MRVLICGGGIGGLTLAHVLGGHAEVVVVDKDSRAEATGGYRLHLNAEACAVLETALEEDLMRQIRSVSDGDEHFSQFAVTDRWIRPLVVEEQPAGEDRLLCDRVTLRTLLAEGLESPVVFGRRVIRVEADPSPSAVFDDGTRWEADVIVGAEGSRSPTVAALAGAPTARATGLHGIAGTCPLPPGESVPRVLLKGPAIAVSETGHGLFLSLSGSGSTSRAEENRAFGGNASANLVWGLISRRGALPPKLPADGGALRAITRGVLAGWDPGIVSMIERTPPESIADYSFRAVNPRSDLTPWGPSALTAIGDAVHCMPPTGGQGASTAIRDAGVLAEELLESGPGRAGIEKAIASYESRMPSWAVPAVRESLGPVRIIKSLGLPGASLAAAIPLRIAGRIGQRRYARRP